ncbi:subtilisin-like protein [Whalleya microplaca]|nr:subtilisin-like protein [Whalleya microplaca]
MKSQGVLLPLLGASLINLAAAAPDLNITAGAAPTVPGAYIVELENDQDANSFYKDLHAQDMPASPRLNLSYSLFKGYSFQLKNTSDANVTAQRISEMPNVKKVWPVKVREIPKDEVVWVGNSKTASSSLKKRQESENDTYSPHVMTQVDKLRAKGFTGKGIKIGIVDTGVDYKHPALGNGCFGSGCLVSYGTDLVGDAYTGQNDPVPDSDPYDNCAGHGTHVAGIIAAQPNELGFTGAAPDVTLGMYRVFGCDGGSGDDVLIAAFNQAFEDGSDIITASIGSPTGWSEDPWAVTVQRIVEAGVPCTISAGNEGSAGLFYASSAADGKKVTAVASVQNTQSPVILLGAKFSVNNGSREVFGWEAGTPAYGNVSLPLWAVSNNTAVEDDACNPLPDGTPDLSGYVVLVRQGTCINGRKAENVVAKGAKYIMLYNSVAGGPTQVYIPEVKEILGAGMVTADQGAEWVKLLNEGKQVIVQLTDPDHSTDIVESELDTKTGGLPNDFTTWGPTWEVEVKPQVGAPGGNILSTWPLALGGYSVLSGTSMACPLTAAVYALVSQVRGTRDPSILERLLSSTANPNIWAEGTGDHLAPVPQQGAGLIQAYDAAYATTILSVASISFNDTVNFIPSANFTIENLGSDEVTYELGHVEAVTMYTFNKGKLYPAYYPNPTADAYATLGFSTSKVTIPAGQSAEITVSPTPPSGLDETLLPVYSGYVTINGTNGDSLSIPYLGVVGSMSNHTVLDPDYVYLSNYTDYNLGHVPGNSSFSVPYPTDPKGEPITGVGYPAAIIQLNVGTAKLRCDVVPVGIPGNLTTIDVFGVKTVGSVFGYPVEYSQRRYYISAFTGLLADGTVVPEGKYSFLVRGLKIFGDPTKEEDYQTLGTVPFQILYT